MRPAPWCGLVVALLAGCSATSDPSAGEAGTTAAATTVPAPTQPTTAPPTTEPDPCALFENSGGYERMMAVKDGAAPTDKACRSAVDLSALALNTFENSLEFSEQLALADRGALIQTEFCDQPGTVTSVFTVPVMVWGVTRIVEDGVVISYEPFVSEVIQPGGSGSLNFAGFGSADVGRTCSLDAEAIVAPTGGLAAGIAAPPAADDDPLAADDPQVWGPALLEIDASGMDVADYVNRVEDIHSPDVGDQQREIDAGERSAGAAEPITYAVCGSEPADLGADVAGEYAWLVFAAQAASWQGHYVGLFSRGADLRWRFLGTPAEIDQAVDPADPCALPPRSIG